MCIMRNVTIENGIKVMWGFPMGGKLRNSLTFHSVNSLAHEV